MTRLPERRNPVVSSGRHTLTPFTSTSSGSSQAPVWAHDGKRVAYRGTRNGFRNIFWKTVDGGSGEERLTKSDNSQTPGSFSPKDDQLSFSDTELATGADIWVLHFEGGLKPTEFRKVAASDFGSTISPDGRWLAYSSNESGKREIYVLPFPGPSGKNFPISTDGGIEPVWSRVGHELFYRNGNKMMAVDVAGLPDKAGTPRLLFEGQFEFSDTGRAGYDVHPDGRFLMVQSIDPELPNPQINVVIHWFEELKRLVP